MIRSIAAACLLASLAGPALAAAPVPPPSPNCSGLTKARADARTAAAPLQYDVFDLDDENARSFLKGQDIAPRDQTDHLTVMVNRKTGRAAALLNDGQACGFQTVIAVFTPPYATGIDAALDLLGLAC